MGKRKKNTPQELGYKVICISMYLENLDDVDRMVEELKAKGLTKISRSALIRYALSQVNLDDALKAFRRR